MTKSVAYLGMIDVIEAMSNVRSLIEQPELLPMMKAWRWRRSSSCREYKRRESFIIGYEEGEGHFA